MKIVRTYPPQYEELSRTRNRVDDQTPRTYIQQYDNRPLLEFDDNLVVLEWDIAVDLTDLETFCEVADATPDQMMVAPYRMYPNSDPLIAPGTWAHRIVTNPAALTTRWVTGRDWACDFFGLGMTYIPREIMQGFASQEHTADPRMTDANLSVWHYRNVGRPVPICWAVRPVHLNYTCPGEYPWN